jgi:hypothetical protein
MYVYRAGRQHGLDLNHTLWTHSEAGLLVLFSCLTGICLRRAIAELCECTLITLPRMVFGINPYFASKSLAV